MNRQQQQHKNRSDENGAIHESSSLYPSRIEVESIAIPDCDYVFSQSPKRRSNTTTRCDLSSVMMMRETMMQRDLSSLSIMSPTPSLDDLSATSTLSTCTPSPTPSREAVGGGASSYWHHSLYRIEIPPLSPPPSAPPAEKKGVSSDDRLRGSSSTAGLVFAVSNSSYSPPKKRHCIEVAPGTYMHLIGTDETKVAMKEGRMIHTCCLMCNLYVVCTDEADCVLCPSCRGVSPITTTTSSRYGSQQRRNSSNGTVGLGLSESDYFQFQLEQEQQCVVTINSTTRQEALRRQSFTRSDF